MSTRWAYVGNSGMGSIARIYCTKNPSDEEPAGEWIVVRRVGHNSLLKNVSESSFFYYEDKNAYKAAKINAQEVAKKYMELRQECCIVM